MGRGPGGIGGGARLVRRRLRIGREGIARAKRQGRQCHRRRGKDAVRGMKRQTERTADMAPPLMRPALMRSARMPRGMIVPGLRDGRGGTQMLEAGEMAAVFAGTGGKSPEVEGEDERNGKLNGKRHRRHPAANSPNPRPAGHSCQFASQPMHSFPRIAEMPILPLSNPLSKKDAAQSTVSISATRGWRTMSRSDMRTTAISGMPSRRRAMSPKPESPSRRSL